MPILLGMREIPEDNDLSNYFILDVDQHKVINQPAAMEYLPHKKKLLLKLEKTQHLIKDEIRKKSKVNICGYSFNFRDSMKSTLDSFQSLNNLLLHNHLSEFFIKEIPENKYLDWLNANLGHPLKIHIKFFLKFISTQQFSVFSFENKKLIHKFIRQMTEFNFNFDQIHNYLLKSKENIEKEKVKNKKLELEKINSQISIVTSEITEISWLLDNISMTLVDCKQYLSRWKLIQNDFCNLYKFDQSSFYSDFFLNSMPFNDHDINLLTSFASFDNFSPADIIITEPNKFYLYFYFLLKLPINFFTDFLIFQN